MPTPSALPVADPTMQGLSEAEAERRRAQDGPNRLSAPRRRRLPQILRDIFREPMFLLLLAAVGFYFLLGDTAEAVFLGLGAVATIGLVVVQEARSERALAALKALAEPTARVIRDGVERRIAAADLVQGDLVLVGEGGRAPADGVLVAGDVLSIDESVLTGESAVVDRAPLRAFDPALAVEPPEGARICAGGLLVRGHGVVRVTAIGAATRLGQIGAALAQAEEPPTPLQRTTRRLVGVLGLVSLGISVAVLLAHGLMRADWVGGVLAALTVGIALIPEEFPMVLAVFLALGGWRLAKVRVLVRRTAAVEALGGISVLCVDKTGTLTRNEMRVAALWAADSRGTVSGSAPQGEALLRVAILASATHPLDPMDRALHAASSYRHGEAPLRSYPLRPDRLAFIQAWAEPDGAVLYAAKGAPEAVFDLCRLAVDERAAAEAAVSAFAGGGLRVLGVAQALCPSDGGGDPGSEVFRFEGLVAFEDPVRDDVPPALASAAAAWVKVVMITGDFPATALAIARDAGLDVSGGVLTGAQLQMLGDAELREAVGQVRVFARISPDQKLRLVRALQANGERVGMFGDGVNDAPALEAADVGVAMGRRGVDVAREAADLILLDDRFASVVAGIAEGRRIFANLKAALAYLVVVHIPMAGLALLPPLLGLPPILFPMQVVLLELVIDPMCALVFEGRPAAADAMRRPPRAAAAALASPARLAGALLQGLVLLGGAVRLDLALLNAGHDASVARAAAFVFVVATNLGVAAVIAGAWIDGRQRLIFAAIAGLAVAAVAAALLVPLLARLFAFGAPNLPIIAVAAGLGVAAGLAVAQAGRLRLRTGAVS
ncbi:HAD-IC family P-type ATPase [uncultured Phenylobacterium sp.]|uniref:cation-translocating P-type ATPase n=1 Tax=uncultured Phenylobacterium sp. TaxID=349273 RepID=UPI0025E3FAD5|nr:HAD-IC family P-type ATPase [uncultured Phenylobacterium sp.]